MSEEIKSYPTQPSPKEEKLEEIAQSKDTLSASSTLETNNKGRIPKIKNFNKLNTMGVNLSESLDESHINTVDDVLNADEKDGKDAQYVMGYFDWYWRKNGFWGAFKKFLWKNVVTNSVQTIFYQAGFVFGGFAM